MNLSAKIDKNDPLWEEIGHIKIITGGNKQFPGFTILKWCNVYTLADLFEFSKEDAITILEFSPTTLDELEKRCSISFKRKTSQRRILPSVSSMASISYVRPLQRYEYIIAAVMKESLQPYASKDYFIKWGDLYHFLQNSFMAWDMLEVEFLKKSDIVQFLRFKRILEKLYGIHKPQCDKVTLKKSLESEVVIYLQNNGYDVRKKEEQW